VFLTDKFVERTGPHARGKRRGAVCALKIGIAGLAEQIVHRQKIRRGRRVCISFPVVYDGI
jgi:hypothetical protein